MQLSRRSRDRSFSHHPVLPALLLLLGGLASCSTMQPVDKQSSAPDNSTEQRLQALETNLQRLSARLDAIQDANKYARTGWRASDASFDQLPAEAMPVTPVMVLASSPARRAPALQPAPGPAPAIAPAPDPAPVVPAPAPVRESVSPTVVAAAPRQRPVEGEWVINLASYVNASFAARKQTEFEAEGVAVERVQASVKGKTVYRLRVPGFESFRAASAQAGAIQAQLDLDATWVARR